MSHLENTLRQAEFEDEPDHSLSPPARPMALTSRAEIEAATLTCPDLLLERLLRAGQWGLARSWARMYGHEQEFSTLVDEQEMLGLMEGTAGHRSVSMVTQGRSNGNHHQG